MLLREVLQRCDRDRTPAYLEATSPENVRLYRRHGFEVTGEICLPDGPSLWPMWRAPNPAQGGQ
jgi:predicted GNAT family N-acyltransferase